MNLTCGGMTTETQTINDEQVIRIRDIAAKKLSEDVTVNVSSQEGNGTITYSPLTYPELFTHILNCICKWLCIIRQLQS